MPVLLLRAKQLLEGLTWVIVLGTQSSIAGKGWQQGSGQLLVLCHSQEAETWVSVLHLLFPVYSGWDASRGVVPL